MTKTEATAPLAVTRWRKRPVVIEAHQWFKNGDHPDDSTHLVTPDPDSTTQFEPFQSEGEVVRYFRHPDIPGDSACRNNCGYQMAYHGWVDTLEGGHIVCPGDWIITGIRGERYPCKDSIFRETYEPADADPDTTPVTRGDLAAASLAADRARETIGMLGEDLIRQRKRAERAEAALRGAETNAGDPADAVEGEGETPEATEAEIAALRAQLPSVLAAKLGRIRELAEYWVADDGHGSPTLEMAIEAECGRQLLAITGDQP